MPHVRQQASACGDHGRRRFNPATRIIKSSDNTSLKILLCDAKGDSQGSIELRKLEAANSKML